MQCRPQGLLLPEEAEEARGTIGVEDAPAVEHLVNVRCSTRSLQSPGGRGFRVAHTLRMTNQLERQDPYSPPHPPLTHLHGRLAVHHTLHDRAPENECREGKEHPDEPGQIEEQAEDGCPPEVVLAPSPRQNW
jgi:hypothetical protein